MDKAKEAAEKAKVQAQQMAQQGQAKVQDVQRTRTEHDLYQKLGQACYAEQRRGGDHLAVESALSALDAHFASAATAGPGPAAPGGPTPSTGTTPPPPSGDFKIDDV